MGGKPPLEFLGTPSKSVIYHPRNMSGKFGAIGRHVTISRLRALTTVAPRTIMDREDLRDSGRSEEARSCFPDVLYQATQTL